MKSFVSIVAGLLVIVILAVVTDTVLQSVGVEGELAPGWYGWALILLALPVTWLGDYFYARGRRRV